VQDI